MSRKLMDPTSCAKRSTLKTFLTIYFKMLQNGQTYFKNLTVRTPQDFYSMFDHFATS